MPSVFISYRHDDSFASAKLLVEHLERWLPDSDFFIDESGIQAGEDWRATGAARLDRAQILLGGIGTRWLPVERPGGGRRLHDGGGAGGRGVGGGVPRPKRAVARARGAA